VLNIRTKDRAQVGGNAGADLSRDGIVRALEHDILTGKLRPGERLDERALAAHFGVSRAPVRDAIGRLASLGMIDVKPRSGSYVTSLNASEVFELFEVMAGLEGLCAFYAAQRLEVDGQAELRRLATACTEATSKAVDEYLLANFAFHECVYRGTKNNNLERLTRQARQRVSGYRNYTLRLPGRLKRSAEEHLEITEAICAGDALTAQRLMTIHADVKRSDFAPFISMIDARSSSSSSE
jgi:DNA-binding GntR family transcriptional regulator